MAKCRICCCTDLQACPGGCYWVEPDLCSVCAAVTPEELAAAREAAFRVKEFGPSATRDLTRYAHAIAGAVRAQAMAAQTKPKLQKLITGQSARARPNYERKSPCKKTTKRAPRS